MPRLWTKNEEEEAWLLFREGHTMQEIAEKLGRSLETTKRRFVRIKRRKANAAILEKARELYKK